MILSIWQAQDGLVNRRAISGSGNRGGFLFTLALMAASHFALSASAEVITTLTSPALATVDADHQSPGDDRTNLTDFSAPPTGDKPFTTTLYIRGNNSGTVSVRDDYRVRAYVKFDLSAIASGGLTTARLTFSGYSLAATAVNISASRLTGAWPPFSYNPSRTDSVNGGSIVTSPLHSVADFSIDVTSIVAQWVNHGAVNNGFFLELSNHAVANGLGIRTDGAGAIALVVTQDPRLWWTEAGLDALSIQTNRATATATLAGEAGATNANVWLCWSTNSASVLGDGVNATHADGVDVGPLANVALTNLTPDTVYFFAFFASNTTHGATTWSATNSFPTRIMAAPQILKAEPNAANPYTAVDLQWLDNFNTESSFLVRVSNATDGAVAELVAGGVGGAGGAVTCTVSNLTPGVAYDFRVAARNATAGDGSWSTNVTAAPLVEFEYTEATHRLPIAFDNYPYADALTNFPVLVVLKHGEQGFYTNHLDSLGRDLRFALNADGSRPLNYELEGTLSLTNHIWVQVPTFTNHSSFYAFWGSKVTDPAPSQTNGSVWSEGYEGVWHLNSGAQNSTAQPRNGAMTGTAAATGIVGGARSFNGSSDVITISGYKGVTGMGSRSITVWMKTPQAAADSSDGRGLVSWGTAETAGKRWEITVNKSIKGILNAIRVNVSYGNKVGTRPVTDSTWRMVGVTLRNDGSPDTSEMKLFIDGYEDSTSYGETWPIDTGNTYDVRIGNGVSSGVDNYGGLLDEVRISSVERSSNWLWACYATVASNNFAGYGTADVIAPPELAWTDVAVPPGAIETNAATAAGTLVGVWWATNANVWLYWSENPSSVLGGGTNDTHAGGVGTGVVASVAMDALTPDTLYYYAFFASNAEFNVTAWSTTNVFPTRIATPPAALTTVTNPVFPHTAVDFAWLDDFRTETAFVVSLSNAVEGVVTNVVVDGIPGAGTSPSVTFSNLTSGLAYTFRVAASNATASGPWASAVFTPPLVPAFGMATHRLAVSFTNYPYADTLTNFPVLVTLREGEHNFHATDLDTLGRDVRFALDQEATLPLDYEMEGTLSATNAFWVRIPAFTSNVTLYAFWGSKVTEHAASQTNGAVWINGYEGVWHFNDGDADSTAHGRHGTPIGGPVFTAGMAGRGRFFDGGNHVAIGDYDGVTGSDPRSVSLWIKSDNVGGAANNRGMVGWGGAGDGDRWDFALDGDANDQIRINVNNGNRIATTDAADNTWHMVAVSFPGGTISAATLYLDDEVDPSTPTTPNLGVTTDAGTDVTIGLGSAAGNYIGQIDEVRISSVARSAHWLWAEYTAVADPAFAVCGQADEIGPPELRWEDVTTDTASITTHSAPVAAILRGLAGPMGADVLIRYSTNALTVLADQTDATYADGIGAGLVALTLGDLLSDAVYYYAFYGTNDAFAVEALSQTNSFTTKIQDAPILGVVSNALAPNTAVDVSWLDRFHTESSFLVSVSNAVEGVVTNMVVDGIAGTGTSPSVTFSNLTSGLAYTFRVAASNVLAAGPWGAAECTPPLPAALAEATYRMRIAFTNYPFAGVLTNFPTRVVLTHGQNGFDTNDLDNLGRDLRFAMNEQGLYPLHYELTAPLSQTNQIWVQIPAFSNGVSIYAFWGSKVTEHAVCQTNGAAWSEGYEGVWHLDADERDSTSHARHGTATGTTAAQGVVSGARSFDASGDVIKIDGYKGVTGSSARSVSLWMNTANAGGAAADNGRGLLGWGNADTAGKRWELVVNKESGDGKAVNAMRVNVSFGNRIGNTALTDSQWRQVAVTFESDGTPNINEALLYVNGLQQAVSYQESRVVDTAVDRDVWIGRGVKTDEVLDYGGLIDEVRIASVARSAHWLWAEYATVASDTFAAYGGAQLLAPTRQASNLVFSAVTNVQMTLAWENGNGSRRIVVARAGSSVSGAPLNGSNYAAAAAFGSGDTVAAGEFVVYDGPGTSVTVTNLLPGTNYHFAVFERNALGDAVVYLRAEPLVGSRATATYAPVIAEGAQTAVSMSENGAPINLTLNATDPDSAHGDQVTWSIAGAAECGTATVNGTGMSKAVTYAPVPYYSGADSFVVQAVDNFGNSDTIMVNVTVEAVNPPGKTLFIFE